ncbi:MAG: heme lyase CcmF/NrfE family subunit [Phycisphaeraceae bacterium]|nr:heme lyase CcmF/NrfE family subunit [Phycisphaeraceae bacterium]
MIDQIGTYSLSLAILTAGIGLLATIMAYRFESQRALGWARVWLLGNALLITAACGVLMTAIMQNDFANVYVASYSEIALPWGYKIASFWAGQAGSLLLWAWLLVAMTAVLIWQQRKLQGKEVAATLAIMAFVNSFFAAILLFAANPFTTQAIVPADGHGLNPMLQDPGMIAHPPTMFVGYAGFTIPFAMLIGALAAGRRDDLWIANTRRWLLFSWLFLTIGILLGAQWAYIELGWGGYWAWDPVENASLLPWLTGTALLHSIMVQQARHTFRFWNACLIAITFLRCIFGTYLTRSGVIQSVHTFPESSIGQFFLGFLAVCIIITVVMIIWRRDHLKAQQPLTGLCNREGALLLTNVLLLIITGATLVGTIYPLISDLFTGKTISVGPPFYNKVILPMALLLLTLMAIGPALQYGVSDARRVAKKLRLPVAIAVIALILALILGLREPWSMACVTISALAIANVFNDLITVWFRNIRASNGNAFAVLFRQFDDNHRRYGGQFVHLGMILIMIGVAGSSLFNEKTTAQLKRGEQTTFAGYTMLLQDLHEVRNANFTAVQAIVKLTNPDGSVRTLRPEVRFYDKSEQPNTHVALKSNLKRDLYVTLAGWEQDGDLVALQAIINPLVVWIWIGGIAMTLGALFSMLPKLLAHRTQDVPQTGSTVPLVTDA